MAKVVIVFEGVEKSYVRPEKGRNGPARVLSPIDLEIGRGEFFSIIGPSGCGKSTLLNLLAGLDHADKGRVLVEGQPVLEPGPDRAVVFQEAGLMPWMTVRRNVEYGLRLRGVDPGERSERALKYLRMVHLASRADSYPHQLSGGMRQRVAIARALALEPRVLLMDEPFSALDAQTRDVLHEELQRIWSETRTTIVFITHNLSEAVYLSDRIMIMTTSPGSIKKIVRVPFSHPRLKGSEELNSFAAGLHGLIAEEVNQVAAREHDPDWQPLPVGEPPASVSEGGGI